VEHKRLVPLKVGPGSFKRLLVSAFASPKLAQRFVIQLDDLGRVDVVVGIPEPGRRRSDVGETRPLLALTAIGKDAEVEFRESGAFGTRWLVRTAFVLHCPLVLPLKASNDKRDLGPPSQVLSLARGREGVEYDLEGIGDGDPDDCALRRTARVEGALHGVSTAAQEFQQGRASDGHGTVVPQRGGPSR